MNNRRIKWFRWMMVASGATLIYVAGAIHVIEAEIATAADMKKEDKK